MFKLSQIFLKTQSLTSFTIQFTAVAAQDFGGGGTSDKISFMSSTQVLYCDGVALISVWGDIQQKCTHQKLNSLSILLSVNKVNDCDLRKIC